MPSASCLAVRAAYSNTKQWPISPNTPKIHRKPMPQRCAQPAPRTPFTPNLRKSRSLFPFFSLTPNLSRALACTISKTPLASSLANTSRFASGIEWYQEPGCCKQMPCALTGFANHAEKTGKPRIRLTKSHDFELTDPIYETNRNLRRIVLVRDPLYILTSWFALDQLNNHKTLLASQGINLNKIWLSHEKEVLAPAYQLLNDHFNPPTPEQLTDWLQKKAQYINAFTKKWANPKDEQPNPYNQIVRYEDVNRYIAELASEYRPYLPQEALPNFEQTLERIERKFTKRTDPYTLPAETISEYIRNHAELFQTAAEEAGRIARN